MSQVLIYATAIVLLRRHRSCVILGSLHTFFLLVSLKTKLQRKQFEDLTAYYLNDNS